MDKRSDSSSTGRSHGQTAGAHAPWVSGPTCHTAEIRLCEGMCFCTSSSTAAELSCQFRGQGEAGASSPSRPGARTAVPSPTGLHRQARCSAASARGISPGLRAPPRKPIRPRRIAEPWKEPVPVATTSPHHRRGPAGVQALKMKVWTMTLKPGSSRIKTTNSLRPLRRPVEAEPRAPRVPQARPASSSLPVARPRRAEAAAADRRRLSDDPNAYLKSPTPVTCFTEDRDGQGIITSLAMMLARTRRPPRLLDMVMGTRLALDAARSARGRPSTSGRRCARRREARGSRRLAGPFGAAETSRDEDGASTSPIPSKR